MYLPIKGIVVGELLLQPSLVAFPKKPAFDEPLRIKSYFLGKDFFLN